MAEFITKEFALSCVDSFLSKTGMPIAAQYFYDCFRECKVADVQSIKHGQWNEIYHDNENYSASCSCCQEPTVRRVWFRPYDFCPHCGARMDGDSNG